LEGVAPAYVVTAGFDPLRDEGNEYAAALMAAGVPTTHHQEPTLIHGFANMLNIGGPTRAAQRRIHDHLRTVLNP
jgi:acetyl esterase